MCSPACLNWMVFYEHVADSSPLQLGWSVWLVMTHVCGVIFVFMCHFSHHWHGDHPQVHPTLTSLKQLNTDTISNLKWFLSCWFTIAKSLPQKKKPAYLICWQSSWDSKTKLEHWVLGMHLKSSYFLPLIYRGRIFWNTYCLEFTISSLCAIIHVHTWPNWLRTAFAE